jgi:streptogramin lyase
MRKRRAPGQLPLRLVVIVIVSWACGRSGIAGAQSFKESAVTTAGGKPAGITFGPDSNLWFTEEAGNKIGTITTSGGTHRSLLGHLS